MTDLGRTLLELGQEPLDARLLRQGVGGKPNGQAGEYAILRQHRNAQQPDFQSHLVTDGELSPLHEQACVELPAETKFRG